MNRHPKLYRSLLWIIITGLILACKLGEPLASSNDDLCGQSREPTENDMKFLKEFTEDAFAAEEWQKSYSAEDLRATMTGFYNSEGGLAYAEYLLYNCGYTQNDIEAYFSDQNFRDDIFADYQNLKFVATCTAEKEPLTLYEFSGVSQDEKYTLRYWVKQENQTRLLIMLLAFPESSIALTEQYAQAVFPELPACQR